MNKPLLHGENVFKPVRSIPDGTTTKHKTFIAGHSESGHHHVIECDQEFAVTEDALHNIYVQVFGEAKVVHKKSFEIHETLPLAPGKYQIIPALEYNPFTKVMERQFD